MSTELAQAQNKLAPLPEYTTDQIQILAETVAKGTTQSELSFFLTVCKLKRLDPFSGQVHCVKRWDRDLGREKMAIQIGIDGFRVIAARTGELAGNDEPIFDTEEGPHPNKASVTVYRWSRGKGLGERIPYTASARYSEYVQTKKDGNPNIMWATKPFIMLGKCAEALALRKAFPDELSGMYSEEEMQQADSEQPHGDQPPENGGRKPVQQPQRASEKKQEQPNEAPKPAQTQPAADIVEFSEKIENAKLADGGEILWLTTKGHGLVAVRRGLQMPEEMVAGNMIAVSAKKMEHPKVGSYWMTVVVHACAPVPAEDIADAEFEDVAAEPVEDVPTPGLENLYDAGAVKTGDQVQAPAAGGKVIGVPRARRLHAIITAAQRDKKSEFTEEHLKAFKRGRGIEKTEELPVDIYELVCAFADGSNVDWKQIKELSQLAPF